MADPDRRYESQEPPLTMDSRRQGRPRGPAPVTLIVSVLLLLLVGGAVFYMYRAGARSPSGAPEPLGAPLSDVRAPPPPETRNPDPSAGLSISKDDPNASTAPPILAPPPEQPLTQAPPPTAYPKGFPSALPPPPPPPSAATAAKAPAPRAAAKTPEKADAKPDTIDALIADAAKTKAPKPPKAAAETSGPVLVQIGAFSSESLADKEWSKAAAVAPGPMAGKGKRVVPLTKNGATLYRTSITGFATRDQAVALCDRLKSAGGSCFVR